MNQFITNSATRRSFLQAGTACLAVPFLETLATAEAASATPPKRMIFLGGGFGFTKETFFPTEAGRFAEIGLTEGLSPLQRHQDDITMVSNLTNPGATNPHGGSVSYLTGANVSGTPGKRFFNSISCDQVAARHLGTETRFRSLTLSAPEGSSLNSGHGQGLSLSWDEAGNPIPGFVLRDADEINGNHVRVLARWRAEVVEKMQRPEGDPDVGALAGRPVRLRFVMRDARLYSFQFLP